MDSKDQTVLITGATGFIGRPLVCQLVNQGYKVGVLTRTPESAQKTLPKECTFFEWDALKGPVPEAAFENVGALVNLMGDNLAAGRWTEKKKKMIHDSRVIGTRHLVQSIQKLSGRPSVFVSASATGIYGHRNDHDLSETSNTGLGFLANLCREWEAELDPLGGLGIRTVKLRFGIVLEKGGGMLQKVMLPYKLGLGARLGSGQQWMSWIHREDLVSLLIYALTQNKMSGVYNAVAPHPLRQVDFSKTLAKVMHRPDFLRMPRWVLRIGFGEMSDVLLSSQRVSSKKIEKAGFNFKYAKLEDALRNIFKS